MMACKAHWDSRCASVYVCVCECVTSQLECAQEAALGAGLQVKAPRGYTCETAMVQPSAYWWASLMLMAAMSQQHREDGGTF